MPKTTVATEIHETLDVHGCLTPKVTFNFVFTLNNFTNLGDIGL